jgi:hypothetical protein
MALHPSFATVLTRRIRAKTLGGAATLSGTAAPFVPMEFHATLRQARIRLSERQLSARRGPSPAFECDRCAGLEQLLQEEIGQELTGIALLVTAARRAPATPATLDTTLATITDLLGRTIARCRRGLPDRRIRPRRPATAASERRRLIGVATRSGRSGARPRRRSRTPRRRAIAGHVPSMTFRGGRQSRRARSRSAVRQRTDGSGTRVHNSSVEARRHRRRKRPRGGHRNPLRGTPWTFLSPAAAPPTTGLTACFHPNHRATAVMPDNRAGAPGVGAVHTTTTEREARDRGSRVARRAVSLAGTASARERAAS